MMSIEKFGETDETLENVEIEPRKKRVYGFVDGFNVYHALDHFTRGKDELEQNKYRKYKWLCLRTLLSRFVDTETEELTNVYYFTSFPNWDGSEGKRRRHLTYVEALKVREVECVKGEFKSKFSECRALCKQPYEVREEKQTDINIATTIFELAAQFDSMILVTADSDQVPTIKLLKKLHPEKEVRILPPIGRNSKELVRAAGENSRRVLVEDDLIAAQLPNPVNVIREGKIISQIWKPASW